jgi:aminoglycoside phosphotransferase family enzyme/predicted kinase
MTMAMAISGLETLITDLSSPAAYPHPVEAVRVVQTHISCVFLTGDYAYKIKKPVDFGFLDYSTLSRRRWCCEQEIALNQRLCPDLYLDLVPVTRENGRFCVGGAGTVAEWAVQMRQLCEEDMLPVRLEASTAGAEEIRRIAMVLADFHTHSLRNADIREWGLHGVVARTIFNTLQTMDTLAPDAHSFQTRTEVRNYLQSFLHNESDLYLLRQRENCVRDCHGDLRTQNICLDPRFDKGIQIFDCIEFNEEFRYIDVAADLAYLTMDLDLAGRADLRELLIDAYIRARPDSSLRRILPFYRTYRACVRGNIALLAAQEPEVPKAQREAQRAVAETAYDLARCYARERVGPALLITIGLSGSGKSSLARELGRRLPAVVLSSDNLRKERAGVARTVPLNDMHYSSVERAQVYEEMIRKASGLLARKEHVLLDATFLSVQERDNARQLAGRHDAEFWMLECRCPDTVIRQRLELRRNQENASDADLAVYEGQRRSYVPIVPTGSEETTNQFHLVIDTEAPSCQTATRVVDSFTSV